jgi:hypothetical protein
MPQGLPVSRLISVSVNLSPLAAQFANFTTLLIMGDTAGVVNVLERIRSYQQLSDVAADFGTSAPEYLAAALYFSQVPTPAQLYIGRWASAPTKGQLIGGVLSTANQQLSHWTPITAGSLKVGVDGGALTNVLGLNFSAATTMAGVAAIIQTGIQALGGAFAAVTCTWDAVRKQFKLSSGTTGIASSVQDVQAAGSGTDISGAGFLQMTTATKQQTVPGAAAETALAAVQALDQTATQWYGLTVASGVPLTTNDHLAIAGYVEGSGSSGNPHLYGVTSQDAAALSSTDTTSLGYQLSSLGYNRSFVQYCSTSPYAVASLFGRAFSVNFQAQNSTITLAWKQEPGLAAEQLTSTQADALNRTHHNYYAAFNNNTNIVVNGQMASGIYFDEIWGADWLANQIQVDVYNLLYTSPTKIPQTDSGMNQIATTIEGSCVRGVNNGLLAPGIWQQAGFGQLKQNDFVSKGFYVYTPPLSSQAVADRAARKSVPFQVAAKLAGAVHSVAITVNLNR